jgi:hypothetical protein
MTLGTEIVVVSAATLALFFAPAPLLRRLLRRTPTDASPDPDAAQQAARRDVFLELAATVARLALAVVLVLGILLAGVERPAPLVLTVGVVYFVSACTGGVRRFRQREGQKCLAR